MSTTNFRVIISENVEVILKKSFELLSVSEDVTSQESKLTATGPFLGGVGGGGNGTDVRAVLQPLLGRFLQFRCPQRV